MWFCLGIQFKTIDPYYSTLTMYAWGNFAISYLAINGAISYSAIAYAVDRYIYIYTHRSRVSKTKQWLVLPYSQHLSNL